VGKWDMVVVEVGGPIWWSGIGLLALMFLLFFTLAPNKNHPKFEGWQKNARLDHSGQPILVLVHGAL